MHQVVRSQRCVAAGHEQHAHARQGERRRQAVAPEGTGRARQSGTIRAPVGWRRHVRPHPVPTQFHVNKKEVKLALRSALSAKWPTASCMSWRTSPSEKPRTKDAVAVLKALGLEGRTTIVIPDDDVNAYLSFRNIPKVNVIPVSGGEHLRVHRQQGARLHGRRPEAHRGEVLA